jgi:N-acetylglucosamine-6-phosphate deacetylase
MKCTGIDVSTGEAVEISFNRTILACEPVLAPLPDPLLLAPGFIDLQVNGFAGVDYNQAATSHEEIARSIRALFTTGVTRFYPTVITGPPEAMLAALQNLARAKETLPEGEVIEGFHVEGPHISPEDGPRGAHPRQWVRPPDLDEFRRWQEAACGCVRIVTLAPEWPGAASYIEALVARGVVVSLGHTQASGAQIDDAVRAGATMCTHLGNGAHPVLRRHPNYIWDQLAEDRLAASFIVDGIHLPASFLKVALRAKGIERSILVTDAATPAGAVPGRYKLGELDVELTEDQRVVLAGTDRLAGSALRMDRGVENLMRLAGLPLRDAIAMAARNPARIGRIANRQRGLSPGERADIVQFAFDPVEGSVAVRKTWISGRLVWEESAGPQGPLPAG